MTYSFAQRSTLNAFGGAKFDQYTPVDKLSTVSGAYVGKEVYSKDGKKWRVCRANESRTVTANPWVMVGPHNGTGLNAASVPDNVKAGDTTIDLGGATFTIADFQRNGSLIYSAGTGVVATEIQIVSISPDKVVTLRTPVEHDFTASTVVTLASNVNDRSVRSPSTIGNAKCTGILHCSVTSGQFYLAQIGGRCILNLTAFTATQSSITVGASGKGDPQGAGVEVIGQIIESGAQTAGNKLVDLCIK